MNDTTNNFVTKGTVLIATGIVIIILAISTASVMTMMLINIRNKNIIEDKITKLNEQVTEVSDKVKMLDLENKLLILSNGKLSDTVQTNALILENVVATVNALLEKQIDDLRKKGKFLWE